MLNVTNSLELADAILSGDKIFLAPGTYEIDTPKPLSINVEGAHPFSTKLLLHQTANIRHFSRIRNVSVFSQGDFPALNVDFAAYTLFESVIFDSGLPAQSHLNKTWEDVDRRGIAVQTTFANNGDDTYKVRFDHCVFQFFQTGLDIGKPGLKGSVAWELTECIFNGCDTGINGNRMAGWEISRGNFQLCRYGILLDGNQNYLERVHFERGFKDIIVSGASYYNTLWTDAHDIDDNGIETKLKPIKARNIGRKK